MKKLLVLCAVWLVALITSAADPKAAPVFQMRLVLDAPTADTERMTNITQYGDIKSTNIFNVQKTVLVDQTAIKSATVANDALGQPTIEITFSENGAKQFARITKENIDKRLAIIVAGELCEAPTIRSEITGGQAVIAGRFSAKEINDLAKKINDSLPKK